MIIVRTKPLYGYDYRIRVLLNSYTPHTLNTNRIKVHGYNLKAIECRYLTACHFYNDLNQENVVKIAINSEIINFGKR